MFRLCARHSILNISPYYLKADFIFPLSCDSKNSCPDTTRKDLKSLEDVDTTAGLQKKNIYISLKLYHTLPNSSHRTSTPSWRHGGVDQLSALPWVLDHVEVNPSATHSLHAIAAGHHLASAALEGDIYVHTSSAAANRSWLQVVFVSNESTLIRAWPQCKLPWCFTDVAC